MQTSFLKHTDDSHWKSVTFAAAVSEHPNPLSKVTMFLQASNEEQPPYGSKLWFT